jgi:hypothetical protein
MLIWVVVLAASVPVAASQGVSIKLTAIGQAARQLAPRCTEVTVPMPMGATPSMEYSCSDYQYVWPGHWGRTEEGSSERSALQRVFGFLDDPDPTVRQAATKALDDAGYRPGPPRRSGARGCHIGLCSDGAHPWVAVWAAIVATLTLRRHRVRRRT